MWGKIWARVIVQKQLIFIASFIQNLYTFAKLQANFLQTATILTCGDW